MAKLYKKTIILYNFYIFSGNRPFETVGDGAHDVPKKQLIRGRNNGKQQKDNGKNRSSL